MSPEQLRDYLAFYQDLGIRNLYARSIVEAPAAVAVEIPEAAAPDPVVEPAPVVAPPPPPTPIPEPIVAPPPQPPAPVPEPIVPAALFEIAPEPPAFPADDTLARIREEMGDCRRCRLHEGRNKLVFGSGNEQAKLVFVGEGPGADEDASGLPFVGRAGQLLTQMINNTAAKEGMWVRRDDVYICNVVKSRPPENRTPLQDEMDICGQFLMRQLMAIKPKAIVALGATAAKFLLQKKDSLTRMRGQWHDWRGIPVMVTYHPSYLLRVNTPQSKREAWEDLKKALHLVYDGEPAP